MNSDVLAELREAWRRVEAMRRGIVQAQELVRHGDNNTSSGVMTLAIENGHRSRAYIFAATTRMRIGEEL